jgi:NADH-quinone oxidoreductase subunit A
MALESASYSAEPTRPCRGSAQKTQRIALTRLGELVIFFTSFGRMEMFEVYFPIFVLIFFVTAMALGMIGLSYVVGRRVRSKEKLSTYECGNVPFEDARGRYPVKFYLVAILFIIFDIEVVFLYPWAVTYKRLGLFGLIEMGIFLLILLAGYFYIIKKGALDWEESEEIG